MRSADGLLHLALLYGPGGLSLRSTASYATEVGIADLCDVSLLDRLRNANDFLTDVLTQLLAHRRGEAATDGRLRLGLVDGSTISLAPPERAATGGCTPVMSRPATASPTWW